MKLIIFFMLVLIVAAAVWYFWRHQKLQLVAHARLLIKAWSVWLASIGTVAGATVASFPEASMNAWNSLPEDVKSLLPHNLLSFFGPFLVAMAVIAQFIRQKKLAAQARAIGQQSTVTAVKVTNPAQPDITATGSDAAQPAAGSKEGGNV